MIYFAINLKCIISVKNSYKLMMGWCANENDKKDKETSQGHLLVEFSKHFMLGFSASK